MPTQTSFLRTPRPQYDLLENAEVSQLRGLVLVVHHISFYSFLPQQAITTMCPG